MLVKCPDCGKPISEYGKFCSNCGRPNPAYMQKQEVHVVKNMQRGFQLATIADCIASLRASAWILGLSMFVTIFIKMFWEDMNGSMFWFFFLLFAMLGTLYRWAGSIFGVILSFIGFGIVFVWCEKVFCFLFGGDHFPTWVGFLTIYSLVPITAYVLIIRPIRYFIRLKKTEQELVAGMPSEEDRILHFSETH